jgi:hypothetical protein
VSLTKLTRRTWKGPQISVGEPISKDAGDIYGTSNLGRTNLEDHATESEFVCSIYRSKAKELRKAKHYFLIMIYTSLWSFVDSGNPVVTSAYLGIHRWIIVPAFPGLCWHTT